MTEEAALRELAALIDAGGWRPLPGAPGMLVFMRMSSADWVDTLAVSGETTALVERTNPEGVPVWRHIGTLTEVIAALRALPAPGDVNAPRQAIPRNSADRNF